MLFDEIGEIKFLQMLGSEFIGTGIEILGNTTHGAAIGINGDIGFALTGQCVKMFLVQ